ELGRMAETCKMKYTTLDSPLGKIELSGCEQGLHGIRFLRGKTPSIDDAECAGLQQLEPGSVMMMLSPGKSLVPDFCEEFPLHTQVQQRSQWYVSGYRVASHRHHDNGNQSSLECEIQLRIQVYWMELPTDGMGLPTSCTVSGPAIAAL
ncbi:hypothetical protein STEG23_031034, partial [Scotinomys teguina]